jgi:thiol-disulfide isomerase/thioredoxin
MMKVAGLMVALVLGQASLARASEPACTVKVGSRAPPFSLSMADGSDGVSLNRALAKGVPVVVGFWAYHCVPCQKELPMLQKLAKELGPKATFLLIHAGPDETKMKQKLAELQITALPSASDDTHRKEERYCVTSLPHTFVVDKTGIITAILPVADEARLRAELGKLGAR